MKKITDKKKKPMTPLAKQKQKAAIISYYVKKRESEKKN